jgi:TonB-linked SusC/RagA family outer membrane protein
VTDAAGEPVIGANIVEKGVAGSGVITGADGKFALNVSSGATLVVSYIGFVTQEIAVGNQTQLQIILQEDTRALEEVVVIGYGTLRKSDLTGSVSSVSEKQFRDQPVKQISDILKGRVAGVEVTTASGFLPDGGVKVRIRGTTSINKSSDPLYIIDGIVSTSGLNGLNPADIQSMEVLKDASATAIYGSRGANGVILVTTRSGETGKVKITADVQIGISNILKKYDLLDAYEYALAINDILGASMIPAADVEAYKNGTKGIDWQDLMLQTGVSQDYKVGISGGSAKSRYLISGNLLNLTPITITTKYRRAQLRVNLDNEVTSWLTVSTKINASRIYKHNGDGVGLGTFLSYSPSMDMKNEETGYYNRDIYNSIGGNPYGERMLNYNDSYQYNANGNINLLFKIIDGLTLSVQGGGNYYHAPAYSFGSSRVAQGNPSSMGNSGDINLYWQNTNNLTYRKEFGDHSITTTVVWETSKTEYSAISISGTGLSNDAVGYYNVGNAASRNAGNGYSDESMASGVGRLFYSYKGKYMLTGTFRADGSSKFQGDNKWGYFPSGSVAWDLAKESFMSDQNLFRQLKIRGSLGVTGNQDIGRYSTLGMLTQNYFDWGSSTKYTGYWGNSFSTPDVRWEKTYQYDAGVDLSMLNGKLNFSADLFWKDTKDLLFQKSVPGYNGGGSFWVNQGEVKNSGVEFSLNVVPVDHNGLTWESTLNASYVKNEIVDLAGQDFILDSNSSSWGGALQILKPGYPLGSFYLYEWKGFDDEGANLFQNYDENGNKDGLTNNPTGEDQMIFGKATPDWTFGWNNTITWKNWSASLFINAVTGFERLNRTREELSSMSSSQSRFLNTRESYYQGWDKVSNKADAKYPSHTNSQNRSPSASTFWIEDASFLKLKNISIAYRIPKKVAKVADIQLSVSAQNLFFITKYTGLDPEVYSASLAGSITGGIDDGAYPESRTFTFGVKVDF